MLNSFSFRASILPIFASSFWMYWFCGSIRRRSIHRATSAATFLCSRFRAPMPRASSANPFSSLNAAMSRRPRARFVFSVIVEHAPRICGRSIANTRLFDSANRLFGAYLDGNQQFYRNALFVARQLIDPRHFSKEFLIEGTRIAGIRKSYKHAHVELKDSVLRNEVDTVPRGVNCRQDLIELFGSGLRGTHAYHPRDFRARLAAAFLSRRTNHRF